MTHTRAGFSTGFSFLLGFYLLALTLAGAVVLVAAATAQAEDTMLIPVAPAEGAELAYDIPLQPWLVPTILDLKTQFADGLAAEFNGIAENQTGEEMTVLIEAGRELGVSTALIRTAVDSIGVLDVTFGIEGISRMIPAESALRDTLFGFIVWHEFSSTPARGMMTRFERLVGSVTAGGEAAEGLAIELSAARAHLEQAVEQGDLGRISELSPGVIETSGRIDAVCGTIAIEARELGALIDSLSIDSSELLVDRWADASRAAADSREPVQRTGPALTSMSEVLHILVELGGLLDVAVTSTDALAAAPGTDGNLYISWTVLRDDWQLVHDLKERVLEQSTEQAADGEDDQAGEYVGDAATEQAKARISALFTHQVDANAMLAQRAIEYTSTLVAEATDTLERLYTDKAGYSDDLNAKRKAKVFEQVDKDLREDMELGSAKMSARAARTALALGRAFDARGAGSEVDALYNYNNAWLHCLNAGAAAQRSTAAASSR